MKQILRGRIEKGSQEVALAAIMLALFFVFRTCRVVVIPGVLMVDLSAIPIYTAATFLSWYYTPLFAVSTLYGGSNPLPVFTWFFGMQVVFFTSKIVPEKWVPYLPALGNISSAPVYAVLLHVSGLMPLSIYLVTGFPVALTFYSATAFLGGLAIWKTLRRLGVLE